MSARPIAATRCAAASARPAARRCSANPPPDRSSSWCASARSMTARRGRRASSGPPRRRAGRISIPCRTTTKASPRPLRVDSLPSAPALARGAPWRPLLAQFVARRLWQLVLVLIGVSIVVFVTMHLLPGDVAQLLLGDKATVEQLARLRRQLGLDQPVWVQYADFRWGALRGDFGTSLATNHAAIPDVLVAFPVTLQLTLLALGIAVVAGVPLGVVSAVWQGSRLDGAVM